MPRRTVKRVLAKPCGCDYLLSCGHWVYGQDLRIKRNGKLAQPKTTYCGECPSTAAQQQEAAGHEQ